MNPAMIEPSVAPELQGCRDWIVDEHGQIVCRETGEVLGVLYVREHTWYTDPETLQKKPSGGVMSNKNIYYRPLEKLWEKYRKAINIAMRYNNEEAEEGYEIPLNGIKKWFSKTLLKYFRSTYGTLGIPARQIRPEYILFMWLVEKGIDWEKIRKIMRRIGYWADPRNAYSYISWKEGGETYWKTLRKIAGTAVYSKVKPKEYRPVSLRDLKNGLKVLGLW